MVHEPSVAVVVLNWNGIDDTIACLRSLRQVTYTNYKVILVDNGSANNEGVRLLEMFPEIQLIGNETNRGFAGGCNDGINRALKNGFAYIVILNNDCLVEKDWLSKLVFGLTAAHANFASSRIMYYPETDLICSDGDGLLPDGTGYAVNAFKKYTGSGEHTCIFSACGAAAIFSRECLEAVRIKETQFFDELFFAYLEDIDLCARLHARSYAGVCVEAAVVYHKESKTAGQRSLFQIVQMEKNRLLVELLNFPLWLIPVGELYYCLRTVLGKISSICAQKKPRRAGPEPARTFNPWSALFTSRKWILAHLADVYRDRKERCARALIDGKIYRHFCWDMTRLLGLKR